MYRLSLVALVATSSLAHANTYDLVPEAGGLPGGNGTAPTLQFHYVNALALAPDGSYYVPGYYASAVWHVMPDGTATVVAGKPGLSGKDGDGGPATSARFNAIGDVVLAANGDLYIADYTGYAVRKVDHATGIVQRIGGTGVAPNSIDGPGGNPADDSVSGSAATAAAMGPLELALTDTALYVADQRAPRLLKIDLATNIMTVVAGTGVRTGSIDGPGGNPADDYIEGGPAAQTSVNWTYGGGMAIAADGTIYFADTTNEVIRAIDPSGTITTIAGTRQVGYAGDGGPALSAKFFEPFDVAIGAGGTLYVSDQYNNRVRKIAANGVISTVAGNGAFWEQDDDGVPATVVPMKFPRGLAIDPAGGVYVADSFSHRLRRITPTGTIMTVAGRRIGDGSAATNAMLNGPNALASSPDGTLLIADSQSFRVRVVTSSAIDTLAGTGAPFMTGDGSAAIGASAGFPQGIAADATGNIYYVDSHFYVVRKIDRASGVISRVAGTGAKGFSGDGGAATSAQIGTSNGVAIDSAGNLIVADGSNHRIRRIDHATGVISTIAGTGTAGYAGDNGPATSAQLKMPELVAVDSSDNIYFTEDNHVIRRIDHATGVISTVAGTGTAGFAGDGGPATSAQLASPLGLAISATHEIWVVDSGNARVRRIAADGTIDTVAGTGTPGLAPASGGAALAMPLAASYGLAISGDGRVHVVSDQRVFALVPHAEPTGPDAGMPMMPDAGSTPDAGSSLTGDEPGGCGCQTGGASGALPFGVFVLFAITRRRRAVRSQHASGLAVRARRMWQ